MRKRPKAPRQITPYTGRFKHYSVRFLTPRELEKWHAALEAAYLKKLRR